MKKILVVTAIMLGLIPYFSELSNADCTLGVRDCRKDTKTGICYWWECQQTGAETTMIFLGIKCACPGSKSEVVPQGISAQIGASSGALNNPNMQAIGTCDCSKCRSDQYCCPTANGYCGCFPMPCPE